MMTAKLTAAIRGAAALSDMLDHIGFNPDDYSLGYHPIVKIAAESEVNLRSLLEFVIAAIAAEVRL